MRIWQKARELTSSALEAVVETVKLAILLAVPPWPVPRGAPPRCPIAEPKKSPCYYTGLNPCGCSDHEINPEVTLDAEGAKKVVELLDNPPAPSAALEELFKDKP